MNVAYKSFVLLALGFCFGSAAPAAVYNLRIVTDASPDYTDLASFIRSATAKLEKPEEKCWSVFYWNHVARR